MDRQPSFAASPFKAGVIVKVVPRRTFFGRQQFLERGVVLQQGGDILEIIGHVGPEMQQAVWLEHPCNSIGKQVCEQSAAEMPTLPPRVGKVDMHRRQLRRLDQLVEQKVRVFTNDSRVRLIPFGEPFGSATSFVEIQLDAEKVAHWLTRARVK